MQRFHFTHYARITCYLVVKNEKALMLVIYLILKVFFSELHYTKAYAK